MMLVTLPSSGYEPVSVVGVVTCLHHGGPLDHWQLWMIKVEDGI